ncbi:unnamed protein product [Symbiodinium sp. CCMP2592]|nr:unnamed protein product [Symbiodinium sp. CCMP2592]
MTRCAERSRAGDSQADTLAKCRRKANGIVAESAANLEAKHNSLQRRATDGDIGDCKLWAGTYSFALLFARLRFAAYTKSRAWLRWVARGAKTCKGRRHGEDVAENRTIRVGKRREDQGEKQSRP